MALAPIIFSSCLALLTAFLCSEVGAFPSTPSPNENGLYTLTPFSTTPTLNQSLTRTRRVENCDPRVCEEKICRVKGSVSRASFYARCPAPFIPLRTENNGEDLSSTTIRLATTPTETEYCMCAGAYHVSSVSEHHVQSYVQIVPDSNCQQEHVLCDHNVCRGRRRKSNRFAYICEHQQKFYCACFN